MRHYDVQMMGGMILHGGNIAEMVTGEGKTLVATLPAYPECPGRQGRPRRHGERLPGPPRHGVDGPAVHGPGHDRRQHPKRHGVGRAAEVLRLRHHLRHEQRVRLRLPARQHAPGGPRRRALSQAPAAGPGQAALRDHRRSRQHPDRRSPHAADHRRPGARRRHAATARPTRSPANCKKTCTSRSRRRSTPST